MTHTFTDAQVESIYDALIDLHTELHLIDESVSLKFCDALELDQPDKRASVARFLNISKTFNA